jgi:uncharacterized protein YbaR (Trm112 family)
MNRARQAIVGATRICPHCKTTILESAIVCPACRHHLRFDSGATHDAAEHSVPLLVEGTLRHPPGGSAWEYSMVLTIRNGRGEEIARQLVGVGALKPDEQRTFTLAVELFTPGGIAARK